MNINGNALYSYGEGAVIAITAIVMVFAVLLLIIVLTDLIAKLVGKEDETEKTTPVMTNSGAGALPLNINDEDATVACLIASIDYRNEVKKNIQVISVKEVK